MKQKTASLVMSRRRVDAFTLIEMLLVLAIISILIGAGIYKMGGAKESAKETAAITRVTQLKGSILTYEINTGGMIPSTEQGLEALVSKPSGDPQPRRWKKVLDEVPLDPWNNPYKYRKPAKNGAEFEVYSMGSDGKDGTEDDITSADGN